MAMMKRETAEYAFTWLCRGLAVIGFIDLILTVGFAGQPTGYILLLGLFFGPEVVKGQLNINRKVGENGNGNGNGRDRR